MTKKDETKRREYRFPSNEDRFDHVPKLSRVGAHRAVEKAGSGAARFLFAALATVVLIVVGILIVMFQPRSVSFMDELMQGETPVFTEVEAELNPDATVVVLNGTPTENLALDVDQIISEEGWGTTLFSGDAEDQNVEISAVFYNDPADEAFAKGLGEKLGGIASYETDRYAEYSNQLTVLLGLDYAGPRANQDNEGGDQQEAPEGDNLPAPVVAE